MELHHFSYNYLSTVKCCLFHVETTHSFALTQVILDCDGWDDRSRWVTVVDDDFSSSRMLFSRLLVADCGLEDTASSTGSEHNWSISGKHSHRDRMLSLDESSFFCVNTFSSVGAGAFSVVLFKFRFVMVVISY